MTLSRRLAALPIAALAVALVATGCSGSPFSTAQEPVRDESGAITETNESTDVFSLRVGDCLLDAGSMDTEVSEAPTVPCAEAHDFEAYAAQDIEGDAFPGDEAVATQAEQVCYDAFTPFVGMSYEESVLNFNYFVPTASSWEAGDREILCLIYDEAAQTAGSLAGVAR